MTRSLVIVALIAASGMALRLGAAPPALTRLFDAATDAWERGEYSAALTGFIQIVTAPGGDAFLEPIALTTGQLFETRELTRDGRAPRFSPDNSVSPERGVYIVDLQKTITKIELVSRLRTQLKAAMALKGLLPWERATTIVGEPHATRIT